MLCAFGHPVAMTCNMLGVVGSSLTMVKLELRTPHISQLIETGWPSTPKILRPTMLQYVELHLAIVWPGFKTPWPKPVSLSITLILTSFNGSLQSFLLSQRTT